jgi:hypothetical protein
VKRAMVLLAIAVGWSAGVANAQVSSTFDNDLDGWLITGDNDFQWQPAGGNPGGYLDVNDLATGDHNYAAAPPKFLGDWSTLTAADTLSADIYLLNTSGGSHSTGAYMFRIAGPGGAAHAIDPEANYPPLGVWTTYRVALDAAVWTVETGAWAEILAQVTSLRVNAEFVYGDEEAGIDNVVLTSAPGYAYVPCAHSDFNEAGTGDWTFQGTGGASNPASGGNGGGYVSISESASGNSYAFAPAMFLGNWSALDGSGRVTIDLRVVSSSGTNFGSPEFILITGPGGAAHVSLDASDLPAAGRIWKTFSFPVSSAVWTLDSGTWSGVLSEVSEVKIDLEFFDGTETIGFDNFGRLEAGCPPIDDPVVVHDPDLVKCGWTGFAGIYGVVLNPLDGELYGWVRETTSSGGGLYPVSGAGAGVRLQAYDRPAHAIFDTDGDAYVSEDYSGNVYRLASGGTSSLWVSGFHSGDDDPFGMTFAPAGFNGPNVSEGEILVTDRGSGGPDEIWSFSPDTAEGERQVYASPVSVDQFDLAAAPNDTVYVCDAFDADNLYTLDAQGVLGSFALGTAVSDLSSIVYDDAEDRIYVASHGTNAVYRVDPSTGEVTLVADGFAGLGIACLEIDSANRILWVADNGHDRVYEVCLPALQSVEDEAPHRPAVSGVESSPNPFSHATWIHFELPRPGPVDVGVYDVTGRLVRNLHVDRSLESSGSVSWDGRDETGLAVSPGVYLVRVVGSGSILTGRVVLVR